MIKVLNILEYQGDYSSTISSSGNNVLPSKKWVEDKLQEEISSLGKPRGGLNASLGLPTNTNIVRGDYWRITANGVITGIQGNASLKIGDVLIFKGDVNPSNDNPTVPTQYFALQSNFDTSNDINVGGTFTPASGTVVGSDSIKLALEKIQGNVNAKEDLASFQNGINRASNIVKLGGLLTENTTISGAGIRSLILGANASELTFFEVNTSNSLNQRKANFKIDPLSTVFFYRDVNTNTKVLGKGIEYEADNLSIYTGFTNGTLVHKKYVDDSVAAVSYTFQNGVSESSSIVRAGGVFTQDITFTGTSANFAINTVNSFTVQSTATGINNNLIVNNTTGLNLNLSNTSAFRATNIAVNSNAFTISRVNLSTSELILGDGVRYIATNLQDYSLFIDGTLTHKKYVDDKILENSNNNRAKINFSGNGVNVTFTLNHGLNTNDVIVKVYNVNTLEDVLVEINRNTINSVIVKFAVAPAATDNFRALFIKI